MTLDLRAAWWPQGERIDPLQALQAAAEAMEQDRPVPPAAARLIAPALRDYLAGRTNDLERSLGLRPERGRRSARSTARMQERNDLLAQLYAAQDGKHAKAKAQSVLALLGLPDPSQGISDVTLVQAVTRLQAEYPQDLPRSWEQVQRLVAKVEGGAGGG